MAEQNSVDWRKEHPYKKDRRKKWIERIFGIIIMVGTLITWAWTSGSINSAQDERIKINKELVLTETTDRKDANDRCLLLIETNTEAIKKTNKNTNFIIGQLDVLLKSRGLTYIPKEKEQEEQ